MFKGDMFWLFLYPNTITSLRHDWTHPAFQGERLSGSMRAKLWIQGYADTVGVTYQELMDHAKQFAEDGDYWSEGGRFEGEWVTDEFWDNYEIVTGSKVDKESRGGIFSCSC